MKSEETLSTPASSSMERVAKRSAKSGMQAIVWMTMLRCNQRPTSLNRRAPLLRTRIKFRFHNGDVSLCGRVFHLNGIRVWALMQRSRLNEKYRSVFSVRQRKGYACEASVSSAIDKPAPGVLPTAFTTMLPIVAAARNEAPR